MNHMPAIDKVASTMTLSAMMSVGSRRVATLGLLRKDQDTIHGDLEYATRGFHQSILGRRVGLLELGYQTGSPGSVVSNDAVFDNDQHDRFAGGGCPPEPAS